MFFLVGGRLLLPGYCSKISVLRLELGVIGGLALGDALKMHRTLYVVRLGIRIVGGSMWMENPFWDIVIWCSFVVGSYIY